MSTDNWPPRERPVGWEYRRERSLLSWWTGLVGIALLAAAGAGYYYFWPQREPVPPPAAVTKPAVEAPPPLPEKPAIRHPVPAAEVEKPLPALEQSDARIGELVARLVGKKAFDSFVNPKELIRRIVVTVDNLPRQVAPMRMRAITRVPGRYAPGPANRLRYAAHVKAFEALDTRALVKGYVKLYPLFQAAYVELGQPDGYFNDRVVEAIDDMLAAPEREGAPVLVQPKVLYLYADPGLEGRSAGQKIMMRLGAEGVAKVKAKLREIRRELTAAKDVTSHN